MASSLPDENLTKAKELGKYSGVKESSNENGRPHETSRALATEKVDIIRICSGAGCGKHMAKVNCALVCSCKLAIHCSKKCFKSSNHKCPDATGASKEELPNDKTDMKNKKFTEVVKVCYQRYCLDQKANRGPSSDKIMRLKRVTGNDNRRILRYADSGNPMAAYVIGSAYMDREFDRGEIFAVPLKDKELSVAETDEIAVKWLKKATESQVPEAMFRLFVILMKNGSLRVDQRVPYYWLAQAHATRQMDYVGQILENPVGPSFPGDFELMYNKIITNATILAGRSLANLLMATRVKEIKTWGGKTAMGEPFYGWGQFSSIMEAIGELKKDQSRPSFIDGEKISLLVIQGRPGYSDVSDKHFSYKREENNLKFIQGVKESVSPDYQLMAQTSNVDGRTSYLVSCKHDKVSFEEQAKQIKYDGNSGVTFVMNNSMEDVINSYKIAGKCEACVQEAKQRLRAVSLGQFSLSLTPVFSRKFYTARYANEDGVIIQDVFFAYSQPYIKQALQCLMCNPADLHPLAVAEEAHLFWPIIWFWGSVFKAVQDTCTKATLDGIYYSLGDEINCAEGGNASAMAAFPEDAAGEWRIACGNEDCPRVDHEVKFNLCKGCKVRRYCDAACQRNDWPKHMQYCKPVKKEKDK